MSISYNKLMDLNYSIEEIDKLECLLKKKHIKISRPEIQEKLKKVDASESVFPLISQRALALHMMDTYEKTRKKEVIVLEELNRKPGSKKPNLPVTILMGIAAEDWPGMSNAVLGIVHHRERNVLFIRGFTIMYDERKVAVLILCFQLDSMEKYETFKKEKKIMVVKIREAAHGSSGKYQFLEDEAIKFEIYNDIIKRFMGHYSSPHLVNIIEESGEILKFITSRSREYLENRKIKDLANLIINNYIYQNMIRSGVSEEVIRIKNFKTKTGKELTGITFVCKEGSFSIEDFLMTLNHIVPDHIIKHHKSFVTVDGILVYRIEIVDRYESALNANLIKTVEKSMEKMIAITYGKKFSKLKAIGGFEHYARAIIPFLSEEVRRTKLTQVFIDVARKTEFQINVKLVLVSSKSRKKRIYDLSSKVCRIPGVTITSVIPTKVHGHTEINILRLKINLSEFSSIKEIYISIKKVIRKVYGNIRDFDEGFRDIYIKTLNRLLDKLDKINPALIRAIFFNVDELFKIEIPFRVLEELVMLCSKTVEKSMIATNEKIIFKYKNLKDLNRTLVVVSYEMQKRLMSKMIQELKDVELYFTKIEWNQRSYLIMVLSKDNNVLDREFLIKLRGHVKDFV